MDKGFILLHRKIADSWIFQRSDYFHWFTILLFEVNFKDNNNFLFNGKIMPIKRGEIVTSYQKLVNMFPNSSVKKVRNFIKLLEESKIIIYENLIKGAKITILKYDTYQSIRQPNGNQTATKRQPNGNNRKKEKEERKKDNEEEVKKETFNFRKELLNLGIENQIVLDFLKVRKNKKASDTVTAFNSIKKQIEISEKSANECIKIAVEKSWAGFNAKWLEKENKKEINNFNVNELF